MNIEKVTDYHIGKWKCQILTDRSDGRPGSQAYSSRVQVSDAARFRTKRLNDEDTLQGNKDGDTDVVITMRAPVRKDERLIDLYWVARRKLKVEEGREECLDRNCYKSSRSSRVDNSDDEDDRFAFATATGDEIYEIELEIEELFQEDIDLPLYLIKEFRRKDDDRDLTRYEMFKVGRNPLTNDIDDLSDGCIVNGEFVEVGDIFEDDDLCIEVECISVGEVDIQEGRRC